MADLELEQPVVGPLADELDPVAKAIELADEEADFQHLEVLCQLEAYFLQQLEAVFCCHLEAVLEAAFS